MQAIRRHVIQFVLRTINVLAFLKGSHPLLALFVQSPPPHLTMALKTCTKFDTKLSNLLHNTEEPALSHSELP
jgi:hypothetical protein